MPINTVYALLQKLLKNLLQRFMETKSFFSQKLVKNAQILVRFSGKIGQIVSHVLENFSQILIISISWNSVQIPIKIEISRKIGNFYLISKFMIYSYSTIKVQFLLRFGKFKKHETVLCGKVRRPKFMSQTPLSRGKQSYLPPPKLGLN